MGLFATAARELRGYRLTEFSPQSTAYWVAKLFGGGGQTASGVSVSANNAMAIATVYASCRNLGEDIGSLPLQIFRVGAGEKVEDRADPAWRILNVKANPEMSAMSFRETLQGHAALRGDGWAEIERDNALRTKALWPLNPARMRSVRNGLNGVSIEGAAAGQLAYLYELPDGQTKVFAPDKLFHLRGFGPDGLRGYSILRLAAEAMGVALATEAYGGRFFANDASPGVVLTHPQTLSAKARENIELSWQEAHQGLDNAHRIAILEEGLSVSKVGVNPVEAQFLETRKWERGEIAGFFRMPPDKIGDYERATFSNIEQSDINYGKYTVRPWTVRWDQQLSADGVVDADHIAEHNIDGLLKGDAKTRGEFYNQLRQAGGITPEQIAKLENWPAPTGPAADQILIPLNMTLASALDQYGMTMPQRAHAAWELLRAGYEADGVNALLGLGDLAHTGFVPGTQNPDPAAETNGSRNAEDDERELAATQASEERTERILGSMTRLAHRIAERPVRVETPAPSVTIAEGAFRNEIHQAPVQVDAPVTIAEGAVQVDARTMAKPTKKRVTRDAAGLITEVTEVPDGD